MTEVVEDPFATVADEDNPFATADDVKAGTFTPTPTLEALAGRMVVMIPRKYEEKTPIPEQYRQPGGPTERERYTVDMTVFGGPLTYWYTRKAQRPGEADQTVEETVPAGEMPRTFTGVWRVEGNIIGALKKVDGTSRPVLRGVVRRGPQAADRKAGKTTDVIERAYTAWVASGKRGPEPRFTWIIDVEAVTPEMEAETRTWWAANKDSIKL